MSQHRFSKALTVASLLLIGVIPVAMAASTAGVNVVKADPATAAQMRTQVAVQAAQSRAAALQVSGSNSASGAVQASEAFSNIDRAYPPSCLGSPVQLGLYANDPNRLQAQITLYGDPLGDAAEQAFHEVDTVTVFRVPCSGGKSAVLVEIDRPTGFDTAHYPIFPNIYGGKLGSTVTPFALRLANDPNTFYVSAYSYSPLINSDVFMVENFYNPSVAVASQTFDFNQSFAVFVDNLNSTDPAETTQFTVPAYNASAYTNGLGPIPITGYMSTNWTSTTQGGEGIVLQVYDNGDFATRTLAFAWFTYDANKRAFWLFGQASVPYGQTQITAQTFYFSNGTFNGTSTGTLPASAVGFVTFKFPDCAHMSIAYNIDASVISGPKGQGSATYARVADVNGLVCQ
jgi:hypothetical protein